MEAIFLIAILLISVVLHEVSHGYVADALGDPTARLAGRLTLNPLKHLDPIGSVLVPGVLILLGGFIFGWARPVPYNPYNLRGGRWGPAYVAGAGPAVNLLLALLFGLAIRFSSDFLPPATLELMILVVALNVMLAIFNLMPLPPLDGSKILFAVLPNRWQGLELWLHRHQLLVLLLFIFLILGTNLLNFLVGGLFTLFTGLALW